MYHPRLKGKHYDMGKHYGDLLYKTGENLSSVIKLSDKQKSFGQRCLPIYEKYMSEIMMEVRELAEGLHQKYEDLACWLFNIYCNEEEHGCTVFAIKCKDKVYLARNMDMFPEYKKTSESFLYRVEGKNTFLAHSTAMISLEDGMNKLYDFVVDSPLKVMARRVGAKYGEMLYSADGYVTAWFMWHLQGG